MHELVKTKTRDGPADPHDHENKDENFDGKCCDAENGQCVTTEMTHAREVIATKKQDGHNR